MLAGVGGDGEGGWYEVICPGECEVGCPGERAPSDTRRTDTCEAEVGEALVVGMRSTELSPTSQPSRAELLEVRITQSVDEWPVVEPIIHSTRGWMPPGLKPAVRGPPRHEKMALSPVRHGTVLP